MKITREARAALLERYKNGEVMSDLAREHGVSRQWVYQIVKKSGLPGAREIKRIIMDAGCVVEGCQRRARGNGLCKLHHTRVVRHGDPQYTRPLSGHGTLASYRRGCRCQPCRAANTEFCQKCKAIRIANGPVPHGTSSAYINWDCRCELCLAARRDQIANSVRRCTIPGCNRGHAARGFCHNHYQIHYSGTRQKKT